MLSLSISISVLESHWGGWINEAPFPVLLVSTAFRHRRLLECLYISAPFAALKKKEKKRDGSSLPNPTCRTQEVCHTFKKCAYSAHVLHPSNMHAQMLPRVLILLLSEVMLLDTGCFLPPNVAEVPLSILLDGAGC